jgi:transketolase
VTSRATRDAYGDALLELASDRADIVVLDSDLARSTRTEWFLDRHPSRFFNMGIAEANMVGVAAGLSLAGWTPFITTYAIFVGRAFDQIRQAVAYANANVKIVATHAGLAASHDGGSHQGIEDLALMRVLPGMTILSPADYHEAKAAVIYAAEHPGPVYIRLGKQDWPCFLSPETRFTIGRFGRLRAGDDVTVIAAGSLVHAALRAAERLAAEQVEATILNASTIKPIDEDAILRAAQDTGCIVVAEEHSRIGGLGSAVAEVVSHRHPVPVAHVSIDDRFGETGAWDVLMGRHGLTADGIATAALEVHRLKRSVRAAVR